MIWARWIGYTKRDIYIVNVILKGQNMEYRRITDNEIDKALDLHGIRFVPMKYAIEDIRFEL